jgi:muramoyltetrapeptide carboxypeptidase
MLIPAFLESGDNIRIISPARKIEKQDLDFAVKRIAQHGYRCTLGEHVFTEENQFAGTDAQRAADINAAFADPEVKAIMAARGGYGCARLLPLLDWEMIRNNPKWMLGYSDVTALHLALMKNCEMASIHSSMPLLFERDENDAISQIFRTLQGEQLDQVLGPNPLNQSGTCSGKIIGGNLSVIYSLQGYIPADFWKDKILFIEDLDEYLYHIDRMMQNLLLSGVLNSIQGLIVGAMSDMHDNEIPFGKNAEEIIAHQAGKVQGLPVIFGFSAGHIIKNYPFIQGAETSLKVSNQGMSQVHFSSPLK